MVKLPAVNSQGEAWCPTCGTTDERPGARTHGASCADDPEHARLVARYKAVA